MLGLWIWDCGLRIEELGLRIEELGVLRSVGDAVIISSAYN